MGNEVRVFKSADDAAIAAIDLINGKSISQNAEYAGRIFQRGENFFFTPASTLGRSDYSHPGAKVPDARNIGTYHTHAGGFFETDEIFSPDDKLKATLAKEIAYLGTPHQRILKFVPLTLLPLGARKGQVEVLRGIYVLKEVVITGSSE